MYMFVFALCLSLIQTTGVEGSPVSFHETPVRNSHQCRHLCNVIKTCQGTVFNLKNRTCSLFSAQFLQKVSIGQDFNTMVHKKEEFVYRCKGRRGCGRSGICATTEDGESSSCIPPPTCARPRDLATLKTPDVGASPMGTEVTYTCAVGYNRTSGEGLSVCKFDQQWSTHSLTCQIIDCGEPPEIDNIAIGSVSTTTYDSSVLYSCVLGFYATSGSGHSVCMETGDWSTPTLVCEIVDCGFPLPIDRMDLGPVKNTTYSFDVSYSCSLGFYKASGSGDSTCLQTREWSTPSLVCKDIPGLLMKRHLGSSIDTLTCRTVTQKYSKSSEPPSLSCESDEMLTDCSAKGDTSLKGTNGIQIVVVGGKPQCLVRYADNTGVATARCCKVNYLRCEYIERGPSLKHDDAKIQIPCYKGFKMFGCNAYTEDGNLDGDSITSNKCYGHIGYGSSQGAYGNGVCCNAPGLRCVWKTITNIPRVNNEMIATCPQGYVLIGCNGRDNWLRARGSYIEGDECRLATTHERSEIYITCCNATMSL